HPLVQQRGVDATEIRVPAQVAGIELRQTRMLPNQAALDRRPGDEETRARSVIGALAAVLVNTTAELRECHRHDALVVPTLLQGLEHERDRVGHLANEVLVPLGLLRVGVEAVDHDIEDARAEAGHDEPRYKLHAVDQGILVVEATAIDAVEEAALAPLI